MDQQQSSLPQKTPESGVTPNLSEDAPVSDTPVSATPVPAEAPATQTAVASEGSPATVEGIVTAVPSQNTPSAAPVNQPRYGAIAQSGQAWRMGERVITDATPQQNYAQQQRLNAAAVGGGGERNGAGVLDRNLNREHWQSGTSQQLGSGRTPQFGASRFADDSELFSDPQNPEMAAGYGGQNGSPGSNNGYGDLGFAAHPGGVPQALPGRGWPIFGLIMSLCAMFLFAPGIFFGGIVGTFMPSLDKLDDSLTLDTNEASVRVDKGTALVSIETKSAAGWKVQATLDNQPIEEETSLMYNKLEDQEEMRTKQLAYEIEKPGTLELKFTNSKHPDETIKQIMVMDGISVNTALTVLAIASVVGFAGLIGLVISIVLLVRRNRLRKEVLRSRGLYV